MNSAPCPCGRKHHDSKRLAREAANRMPGGARRQKYVTEPCAYTEGKWIYMPTSRAHAHRLRMAPQWAREQRASGAHQHARAA